ncbi:hypothetical protein J2S00_002834 [Caldalkalibacillus uzonensis]|uniref:Cbb3-type cytochrome oxidase assembly protein CcoS n=1 Tax=Caldalkalibacillus uzonensis TaxID=353224 RepID=A0ABU0CW19_9BACI|nr:hypothetical protein [Caldalkalibacillus uzonensis]MDQ0340039.1 hypothetical protein [Caldalkalibacillus uzonensis]
MSVMFSSPAFISMFIMGIILAVSIIGAICWAIYHIASGKFHEEYEIATVQKEDDNDQDNTDSKQ